MHVHKIAPLLKLAYLFYKTEANLIITPKNHCKERKKESQWECKILLLYTVFPLIVAPPLFFGTSKHIMSQT